MEKKKKYIFKKILTGLMIATSAITLVRVFKNIIDPGPVVKPEPTPTPQPEPVNEEYKIWKAVTTRVASMLEKRMYVENLDIKTLKITPYEATSSDGYNSALNMICTYSDGGVNKIGKFSISLEDVPQNLEQLISSLDKVKDDFSAQGKYTSYVCTNKTETFAKKIYEYNDKIKPNYANSQIVLCGGQPANDIAKLGVTDTVGSGIATGYLFEENNKICFLNLAYKIDYDENHKNNLENHLKESENNNILSYYLKEMRTGEHPHELYDYSVDYFDQDISVEFRQYAKMYGTNLPQRLDEINLKKEIKECIIGCIAKDKRLGQDEKETFKVNYAYFTNDGYKNNNDLVVNYSYVRSGKTYTGKVYFRFEIEPENLQQLHDVLYFNSNVSMDKRNIYEYTESKTGNEFALNLAKKENFFRPFKTSANFEVLDVSTKDFEFARRFESNLNFILKDKNTGKIYVAPCYISGDFRGTEIPTGDPYKYLAKNPSSYIVSYGEPVCMSDRKNFTDVFQETKQIESYTTKDGSYTIYFQ